MTHSSAPYPEVAIVWGDVETDGLVAHKQALLEVAFLVTDLDLNLLDETGYESTILYTPEESAAMRAGAEPFVQDMHDTSGLWAKVTDPAQAKPKAQVDAEALAYIQSFVPGKRTARLGGNSVRLDLNFLEEHLPGTYGHLHYRMADVSSLCGFAQWWGGVPLFEKVRAHTAMADIRESIAELRYLREHITWRRPA